MKTEDRGRRRWRRHDELGVRRQRNDGILCTSFRMAGENAWNNEVRGTKDIDDAKLPMLHE